MKESEEEWMDTPNCEQKGTDDETACRHLSANKIVDLTKVRSPGGKLA